MFASRLNQENVVYEHQTAAAAKQLNGGGKGLMTKTPGGKTSKTPYKGLGNDENAQYLGGKTGGKGKGAGLFADAKLGKLGEAAFVTPAGPRQRAPLGNKTTNAKATAFQTPAPQTQEKHSARPTSPRLRRAKVKVHQAEADIRDAADEREIEYMPPREVPLPDHPEDWPIDRTYPQLEGSNLTQGWWSEYAPHKSEDEEDEFSDFEAKLKQIGGDGRQSKATLTTKAKPVPTSPALQKTRKDPLMAKAPNTVRSKTAAMALSKPSKRAAAPSFAAPTENAKARLPSTVASKKTTTNATAGNPRHTAAKVASNSTFGYSRGRIVSNVRRQMSSMHARQASGQDPAKEAALEPAKGGAKFLDELFDLGSLRVDDDDGHDGLSPAGNASADAHGDAFDDFQLGQVEL